MECCPRPCALCPGFTPGAHSLAHSPLHLAFGSLTAISYCWCSEHVSSAVTRLTGGYRKCPPTFQVFSPTQSVRHVPGARPADTEGELTAPHQCISALPHWVDSRHRDKKTGDARPCTGRNGKDGTVLRTGIAEGGTGRQAGLALGSHHSKSSVRIHCTPGAGQAGHTAVSKRGAMAAARPVGLSCSRRCSRGRRHPCSLPREAGGRCRRDPRPKFYTGLLPSPPRSCVLSIQHMPEAGAERGRRACPSAPAVLIGLEEAQHTWE